MPLPEFNSLGDLPEEAHRATFDETLARFGQGSLQRQLITARLSIAIVLAVSAGLFIYGARAQGDRKAEKRSDRQYREWRMFGGGPENIHYSTLDQITRDNVHQLEVAWRFDSG